MRKYFTLDWVVWSIVNILILITVAFRFLVWLKNYLKVFCNDTIRLGKQEKHVSKGFGQNRFTLIDQLFVSFNSKKFATAAGQHSSNDYSNTSWHIRLPKTATGENIMVSQLLCQVLDMRVFSAEGTSGSRLPVETLRKQKLVTEAARDCGTMWGRLRRQRRGRGRELDRGAERVKDGKASASDVNVTLPVC